MNSHILLHRSMPKRTQLHRDVLVTVAISALTSATMLVMIPSGVHLLSSSLELKTATQSGSDVSGSNDGGGNSGKKSDGTGVGSNDCVLAKLHCAITDINCSEPPTFEHIACSDPKCRENADQCVPAKRSTASASASSTSASNKSSGDSNSGNSGDSGGGSNSGNGGGDNNGGSGKSGDTNTSGDNGSGKGSQGGPSIPSPASGDNGGSKILGCFTTDGDWTTDRSACDPDQARHFTKDSTTHNQTSAGSQNNGTTATSPHTSVQEDEGDQQLQLQLDSQFHSQNERDAAFSSLVGAATTALDHMNTLSEQTLPVEAATAVASTKEWLQQLLSDLSTGEPTIGQVQLSAANLRAKLQATQAILASSIPITQPNPTDITDPLAHLLSTIPDVFQFLQQQGVVLTQDPLTEYQTAASLYLQYKPECLQNSDACLQMSDVIAHLETMRSDLEQILQQAGRTDLEPQIDQMMQ